MGYTCIEYNIFRNKIHGDAKDTEKMLLYIGAANDTYPIQRYSHIHRLFVFVDGLPESKYYTFHPLNDINAFVESIKESLAYVGVKWKSVTIVGHIVRFPYGP